MIVTTSRRIIYAILTAWTVSFPSICLSGNTRAYFMGDEAAMTAGAGTAIISDAGMLWYNPAGLGGIVRNNLQLSGTILNGKIRRVPNFISSDLPSGVHARDAEGNGLGSVPGSASIIGNASPKWSWGIGFFAADVDYMELTADIQAPYDNNGGTWDQNAAAYVSRQTYRLGPSLGWALTTRLRFGLSLFCSYYSTVQDIYMSAARTNVAAALETEYVNYAEHTYSGDFTVMLRGGMQWEFVSNWHLGVVISTPVTTVTTLSDSSEMRTANMSAEDAYIHEFTDSWDWKFTPKEAAAFSLSLAYKVDKRFWVGAEGEIRPPLQEENLDILWNASLGGRLFLSEKFNWGAGLFTDNSPNQTPKKVLENRINRYGITTGAEVRLPLSFQGRNGGRTLIWATSASISYSLEAGEFGTLRTSPEEPNPFSYPVTQVFFHQSVLYVGTTLYF